MHTILAPCSRIKKVNLASRHQPTLADAPALYLPVEFRRGESGGRHFDVARFLAAKNTNGNGSCPSTFRNAPFLCIELHSVPANHGRLAGYHLMRISRGYRNDVCDRLVVGEVTGSGQSAISAHSLAERLGLACHARLRGTPQLTPVAASSPHANVR